MTEDQAKTKWCPFYVPPIADADGTRGDNREAGSECVASGCMAWRTALDREETTKARKRNNDRSQRVMVGYCGLAGTPANK